MMKTGHQKDAQTLILSTLVIISWISTVAAIDCFKCVSMNGKFPACDDPFHNNHSLQMLESPCMGGRKGRDGLFPATSCIKIAGVFDDTGERITVRGCGLDSGTATTDTEIIRMSHCGRFYYNDRYVHGCLQSCNDADACNAAPRLTLHSLPALLLTTVTLSIPNNIPTVILSLPAKLPNVILSIPAQLPSIISSISSYLPTVTPFLPSHLPNVVLSRPCYISAVISSLHTLLVPVNLSMTVIVTAVILSLLYTTVTLSLPALFTVTSYYLVANS